MNYREICLHVVEMDGSIRFAGIASLDGKIIATEFQDGLTPLLTREESELSIMQSLIRMSTRRTLENKLGKTLYALAVYQKIKRATISLFEDGNKCDSYLMISFDNAADHEEIITGKILPFLKEIGKGLAE